MGDSKAFLAESVVGGDYFVVTADGPIAATEEVERTQPHCLVTDVEPLYRRNGRQGRRGGLLLWKVFTEFSEHEPGEESDVR